MDDAIKNQVNTINQKLKELDSLYHMAALKSEIPDGEISIWSVLLCSDEEYSQQDFADQLFLSKQTVNSIVTNMVKKGFVRLEHTPGTTNRKVIRLTEAGRAYGRAKVLWIFQAEEKAMQETDAQELQACISMLEKYILRLRKEIDEKQ